MKKIYKKSSILIILVTLLCSCNNFSNPLKTSRNRLIILLDLTCIDSESTAAEYLSVLKFSLKKMSKNDALCVYPIDKAALTGFKPIIEIDFFNFREKFKIKGLNKSQSEKLSKSAFEKFILDVIDSLKISLENEIENRKAFKNNTDILGSLKNANFDLESNKNIYEKQSILVLSDMQQFMTGGVKMTKYSNYEELTPKDTTINNFQQANVFVYTGTQNTDPEEYLKYKQFWIEYFKRNNANLVTYNSSQYTNLEFFK